MPASLTINMVLAWVFIWASGWHRDANSVQLGRWRVPCPDRLTFVSGVGTSLVLFTVPLSYTFQGVSIPFIQLIMRGDILVIAPLVDIAFSRRVRWWSWVALGMVLLAMLITLTDRGGLKLPPLAILTVVLYTIGYFMRLAVMILLDPRENAYCVPLERAASLIAGVGGSVLLALLFAGKMPRTAEFIGAAILIAAIFLLSLAPRFARK